MQANKRYSYNASFTIFSRVWDCESNKLCFQFSSSVYRTERVKPFLSKHSCWENKMLLLRIRFRKGYCYNKTENLFRHMELYLSGLRCLSTFRKQSEFFHRRKLTSGRQLRYANIQKKNNGGSHIKSVLYTYGSVARRL